jgi:hypothetical protein
MFPLAAIGTTEFLVIGLLAVIPFWLVPLIHAIRTPKDAPFKSGDKTIWVVLILIGGFIGGVAYLLYGRPDPKANTTGAR